MDSNVTLHIREFTNEEMAPRHFKIYERNEESVYLTLHALTVVLKKLASGGE